MRILLLGSNGQLGYDISRVFRTTDHTLMEWTRSDLDLTTLSEEDDLDCDFDVLINCTSYHKTDEVEDNATLGAAVNATGAYRLARICAERGARLIHFSTDYVFGGGHSTDPLTEAASPAPLNVYGATKLLGEELIKSAACDHLILRVASLFGVAGASGKGGNFVETMINLSQDRETLNVVDDQTMSPTSTKHIAGWLKELISAPSGTYHCVNTGAVTWYRFAKEILSMIDSNTEVLPTTSAEYKTRAIRPPMSALDNRKLSQTIDQPIQDWREALSDYLKEKGHVRLT